MQLVLLTPFLPQRIAKIQCVELSSDISEQLLSKDHSQSCKQINCLQVTKAEDFLTAWEEREDSAKATLGKVIFIW